MEKIPVWIKFHTPNQNESRTIEYHITPKTLGSELNLLMSKIFSFNPSQYLLIYSLDESDFISSHHRIINPNDVISEKVSPKNTLTIIEKSIYNVF